MQVQGDASIPLPVGFSTLSFLEDDTPMINDNSNKFVCDGQWCNVGMQTNQRIVLHGLGFCGPIDADAFYDVIVQVVRGSNNEVAYSSGMLKKRVFAKKGQVFHFVFDQPITIHPSANSDDESLPSDPYTIRFALRGPNTTAVPRQFKSISTVEEGNTQFLFCWLTNQLAELQFTRYQCIIPPAD